MYLKKLQLHGFKSFATRTALDFSPGTTAIVGPNGSGKCLDGDSLVTLADGRDIPIRTLVDNALLAAHSIETLDDGNLTCENPHDIRILSLNPATLRLEARPVTAFVKRTAPEQMLRIRTRAGHEVIATPYHPLFTLENGRLHALKAEELRCGVKVATPRHLSKLKTISGWSHGNYSTWNQGNHKGLPLQTVDEAFSDSVGARYMALLSNPIVPNPTPGDHSAIVSVGAVPCARPAPVATDLSILDHHPSPMGLSFSSRVALAPSGRARHAIAPTDLHQNENSPLTDIFGDEIVEIEKITPREPWVYDLCVAETHNFVAENIIVHNSNVADGLRWVLGEQSMRHLRGKKSEDIIFAGGHGRGALGMAEVTLTLDNTSNWLPSEFSEVTVTRRIFRSGDSDYLINGAKVRLKDLLSLLSQARIGHDSYTIIGQGMVDQALSSRAEERRSLFEDAAGIRHFQVQRNDAEQRLTQTHTNLSRLHDILSEIEPRLGPLAEQARRARDFITARADLDRMQRQWFGFQWRTAHSKVEQAERTETAAQTRADELRGALTGHEGEQQALRAQRGEVIAVIAELRRQRGEALSRVQTLERDRAVAQERAASMERQRKELDGEQGRVNGALTEAEQRITQMEADLLGLESEIEAGQTGIADLESQGHRAKQEQERAEARLRSAQRDAMHAQAKLAAAQAEIGRLSKQHTDRQTALAARRETAAQSAERAAVAQTRLDALREAHETQRAILGNKLVEREQLSQTIAEEQAALETQRSELADAQRERRALTDRLALLQEWAASQRDSAAALAVLDAAPEDDRPRILGTLAQLAQSAPEHEIAFEAALGPFLHAIVAASEDDAWRAASLLHAANAGRATILWPVDGPESNHNSGVEQGDRVAQDQGDHGAREQGDHKGSPLHTEATNGARNGHGSANGNHATNGSVGARHAASATTRADIKHNGNGHVHLHAPPRLTDLLHPAVAPEVATVIRGIVGEMEMIAEDEPGTARWQVQAVPVVTPGGMVAHPAGWLAVGRAQTDAAEGVLARARELRELPAQIDAADAQIHQLEGLLANARAALEDDRAALTTLERGIKTLEAQLSEGAKTLGQAQREAERLSNEAQLSDAVAEQLAAEALTLANDLAGVEARVAEAQTAQRDAADMLESIQEDAETALEAARGQQEELARRRTALAVQQQRYQAAKTQLAQARAQAQDLAAQVQRRAIRLTELAREADELLTAMEEQGVDLDAQRVIVRDLSGKLHEQEAQAAQIEQQVSQLEAAQAAERVALAQAEEELRRAMLEAQRARDAIDVLRGQMVEEMSEEDAQAVINRLDEGEPEEISAPDELSRMRRQIDSLRGRMRSLGGYDPEAPQAYEELKTRYEFLTAQVRDMEEASARLRAVIMELDATMKRRFEETFQAVNERFRQHFVTLFQGGAARLELSAPKRGGKRDDDDEDAAEDEPAEAMPAKRAALAGVEIFVQIPGKKVQELNLLSGGERSMVSAALLFALLETNPPPFCLLDEVDAALDESNVVRFCEILKTLEHQTQFIVITHNRVTMTHANEIYGVSMTESVSRILSMRLAEVPTK